MRYDFDLAVVGGGMTGVAAAVAAARCGVKTILIERNGALGGVGTLGLCNVLLGGRKYFESAGNCRVRNVGGIFEEISSRLIQSGKAVDPDSIEQYRNPHGWSHGCCADGLNFDNESMKVLLDELCAGAGVKVLYFTDMVDSLVEEQQIKALVCHNKSGLFAVRAKYFIDSSGDADLAASAGVPTEIGENNNQSMTPASVLMLVEHVRREDIFEYLAPDWQGRFRFRSLIKELRSKGEWPWPYEIFISMQNVSEDVFLINTVRQVGVNGIDGDSLSEAMKSGRAECLELFKVIKKNIPGFANARIRQISDTVGVRETRRIKGDFILTVADVSGNVEFSDVITYSSYSWDLPDPKYPSHQPMEGRRLRDFIPVPYRVMLPTGVDNLLVPGRSISVERQVLGPLRVMAPCMGMGQAAGTAANLAVKNNCTFAQVNIDELRQVLRKAGAVVDDPVKQM